MSTINTHTSIRMDANKITATYWRYAFPTLVAMLVSGLYQIVDGIFIGHVIGAKGLAAINMVWPWAGLMAGVGLMIGAGTGTLCSIAQGESMLLKAKKILSQGLWLLVLLGVVVGALITTFSGNFLSMQGASDTIQAHGSAYLDVMGWAAPVVMASIALPILVRNLGAPKLATIMMVVGASTNIVLDYLFIVKFGWGLRGAAIATVTGELFSVIIGLTFLFSRYSTVPLQAFGAPLNKIFTSLSPRLCLPILGNGFSSFLMYLYGSFSVVLHNTALLHYGSTINVAAYAIAGYLMTVFYLLAEGLASGMQPIVSYFHGAGQSKPIRQVFRLALKCIVGGGFVVVLIMMIFPHPMTWIFINEDADPALQTAAINAIHFHLFALFLDGFLVLAAAYFQAIGMGKKATAITLGNMCIQVPFLLALAPWLGVTGVLLALPISTIVLTLGVAWMLKRQFAKKTASDK